MSKRKTDATWGEEGRPSEVLGAQCDTNTNTAIQMAENGESLAYQSPVLIVAAIQEAGAQQARIGEKLVEVLEAIETRLDALVQEASTSLER